MRLRWTQGLDRGDVVLRDADDPSPEALEALLQPPVPGEGYAWLDIEAIDAAMSRRLETQLELPEGWLDEALARHGVRDHALPGAVFLRLERAFYHFESDSCSGRPLLMFLEPRRLITIHPPTLGRTAKHVRDTVRHRGAELLHPDRPGMIVRHLIDELIEDYKPVLESWRHELDEHEQRCLTEPSHDTLKDVLRFKKLVTRLRVAIHESYREQRRCLNRMPSRFLCEAARAGCEEANDRYNGLLEEIETIHQHTASAYQVYAAAMNLEMTRSAHRMNRIMERLAVVTSVFMPLTFIVGVYGMNIPNMPEFTIKGFYYVLWGTMVGIAVLLLFVFRRMRWV